MTSDDWKSVKEGLPPKGLAVFAINNNTGVAAAGRLTNNGWHLMNGKPFVGVTHFQIIVLPRETDA